MIQRMSKAEQNRQTQSGPKHRKKSSDLRRRLKTVSDIDEVKRPAGWLPRNQDQLRLVLNIGLSLSLLLTEVELVDQLTSN